MSEFWLEIMTPERDFFKGDVNALIVNTPTGEMEILYHTLPMVVSLASGVIKIFQNNKWMEAVVSEGFVRVGEKTVTMMTGTGEWPYEINLNKNNEEIDELSEKMRKAQSMKEYKMAKAQLAVHLAKLKIKGHDL